MARRRPQPRALHLVFLSTGDAAMAEQAAALARAGASGHLEVGAAALGIDPRGLGGVEEAWAEGLTQADLVVVIDQRPDPAPVALSHPGGRIDWHLPSDPDPARAAATEDRLKARVPQLLAELGLRAPVPDCGTSASRPVEPTAFPPWQRHCRPERIPSPGVGATA